MPRNFISFLPNALTLANLCCGGLACLCLLRWDDLTAACYFVLAGALFDFFDGLAARALRVDSSLGKQLDALADAVSFGLFPALLAIHLMLQSTTGLHWVSLIPLLMLPASAYRLARFTIDPRQEYGFIGMPTPANALIWIGIAMSAKTMDVSAFPGLAAFILNPWFIGGFSILSAFLLNAPLPLLSLKIQNGRPSRAQWSLALSGLMLFFVAWLISDNPWFGLPLVLLLYLVFSAALVRRKYSAENTP